MKNMKVSLKLIVSFMLVLVLTVVVGVIGIVGMSQLSQDQDNMYHHNIVAIDSLANLRELFMTERNTIRQIVLADDQAARDSLINQFSEFDRRAAQYFSTYESSITDMSQESDFVLAKETWLGGYADLKSRVLQLFREGRMEEGYSIFTTDGAALISPISDSLAAATELNSQWALDAMADGEALFTQLTTIQVAVLVISAIIAVVLAIYISRLISQPLSVLSTYMTKAGTTGNIEMSSDEATQLTTFSKNKDETGQTIAGAMAFIDHIEKVAAEMGKVSSGDLSVDIELLSKEDTMGIALHDMADNFNTMFTDLQRSASQVAAGSKQMSEGAQSLAQGSTEQASSIEQLSASINDIASKIRENSETAVKTAKLSSVIKENALKGSHQMDEMIDAVKQINEASHSISQIIKTIDDIAFQTNILALNAAVEAARAGQHGKGFAVVAEEVRNLASKSAEAAKETGVMIQNSVEKAELGSQIAGSTAESLREIVTGITETSQLVNGIADATEEQSQGISQVNIGIDQVAQVVQQNSATAQESAAASSEMSSQSAFLDGLISGFKLKENKGNRLLASAGGAESFRSDVQSVNTLPEFDSNNFGKY